MTFLLVKMKARTKKWNQRILVAVLAILAVGMTGCLQGEAVRTGNYYPPKPPSAPVDVYFDTSPSGMYEEVGIVSATGSDWNAEMTDVVRTLKRQARSLGADAVIITDSWYTKELKVDYDGDEHIHTELHADGIAIKYL